MTIASRASITHLVMLTGSQTAGQGGTWAAYTAALPIALARPHPAAALSAVTFAWGIPSIAARLAGGRVDVRGPRLTGAAAWGLATLAALVPAVTRPTLPVVLVVLAVVALGGTWGVSAGEAAPTWLPTRPDPAAAGSWLAIAANLTLVIGPSGAGNLLTYAGDRAAWGLAAGLSAAATVITLLIPATRPQPAAAPACQQLDQDSVKVPAVLAITAGVYVTMGVCTVLEPLYVRQVLHAGFPVYGWLLAVVGAAGIITSVTAGHQEAIITGRWTLPAAVLAVAAGEVLYLNTTMLGCAFAGAVMFGAASTLFRLSARAIIIRAVPGPEHGRALSGWESVQCLSFVLPTAATGTLVTHLGLRAVLKCCAGLAGVVAAASLPGSSPQLPARQEATGSPPVPRSHLTVMTWLPACEDQQPPKENPMTASRIPDGPAGGPVVPLSDSGLEAEGPPAPARPDLTVMRTVEGSVFLVPEPSAVGWAFAGWPRSGPPRHRTRESQVAPRRPAGIDD